MHILQCVHTHNNSTVFIMIWSQQPSTHILRAPLPFVGLWQSCKQSWLNVHALRQHTVPQEETTQVMHSSALHNHPRLLSRTQALTNLWEHQVLLEDKVVYDEKQHDYNYINRQPIQYRHTRQITQSGFKTTYLCTYLSRNQHIL